MDKLRLLRASPAPLASLGLYGCLRGGGASLAVLFAAIMCSGPTARLAFSQSTNATVEIPDLLQESLRVLPQAYYTSTTTAKGPSRSWFEENIQKADRIFTDFKVNKGSWTYQDAYVAAFRFEGLCGWAALAYPKAPPKLCADIKDVIKYQKELILQHTILRKKKPWEWMFRAEEIAAKARVATK